ncbi:MAG TPA: hypothetical protein VER55_02170 [Ardenticatenaceae bacterium]|nr:hypothetical protein [Ardenticatenaceae bacterium]
MSPEQFADELRAAIDHAILAHAKHPKTARDAVRFADRATPYAIHPIWCAMTLLTETSLPLELRRTGYQALLWHDTIEDTNLPLPAAMSETVRDLIEEMTFRSFDEEMQRLWERSETAKLLKLYDKVSNLLDGTWMSTGRWNQYVRHTLKLAEIIEARHGQLNIVKIARAVCILKQ